MKFSGNFCGLLLLAGLCAPTQAQEEYDLTIWAEDVKDTRWESGAVLAGVTALGFSSWEWGSSKMFQWKPEGWFEADTYLGGSDKLGHAFTSYAVTNVLFDHLVMEGRTPERAVMSAVLTTQAIMTYMEVLDGFSGQYGFSPEDMVSNLVGSGFAYLRATRPGLRELVDFRLEYEFPGHERYKFSSNYLLALKMSGVDVLRNSPLRFLELQVGYTARGYLNAEEDAGIKRSRSVFVGMGLNLSELFFGRRESNESISRKNGRLIFEHIQIPYTATRSARQL